MAENGVTGFVGRLRWLFTPDIRMIPIKISYLLYGCVLGSHIPYLNVFFLSVGLSKPQAGLIIGLRFAPASIAGPLWGIWADYSGRRKLILVLLCLGSAIPLFLMPFVSHAIYPNPHINGTDINGTISMKQYTTFDTNVNNLGTTASNSTSTLFWVLLFLIIVGSVFVGPLPGYIDSMAMNVVKTGKTESSYGIQRIFGSLGFALASLIAGIAADSYKGHPLSKYTAVFFLYLASALLLIPIGYYVVSQTRWEGETKENKRKGDKSENSKSGKDIVRRIIHMCRRLDVIVVMITVLISGIACNLFNSFALMLAQDVIKDATETKLSFLFVIATGAEVLLFPFTTKLMNILGGPGVSMTLGIFSYFVRFLVMAYTTQLWLMLVIQLLHAFGFALAWAAMMEYLHDISPKEIFMSMFLLFQSIMFGLGALLANVVGGYLYQSYGGKKLFGGKAVICGVWTVILVIYYGYMHFKGKNAVKHERSVEKDNKSTNGVDIPELGVDNVVTREDEVTVHSN